MKIDTILSSILFLLFFTPQHLKLNLFSYGKWKKYHPNNCDIVKQKNGFDLTELKKKRFDLCKCYNAEKILQRLTIKTKDKKNKIIILYLN